MISLFKEHHVLLILNVRHNFKENVQRNNSYMAFRSLINHGHIYLMFCADVMSALYSNKVFYTRVCGITVSAFARHWGGYGFNSRPKPRHS